MIIEYLTSQREIILNEYKKLKEFHDIEILESKKSIYAKGIDHYKKRAYELAKKISYAKANDLQYKSLEELLFMAWRRNQSCVVSFKNLMKMAQDKINIENLKSEKEELVSKIEEHKNYAEYFKETYSKCQASDDEEEVLKRCLWIARKSNELDFENCTKEKNEKQNKIDKKLEDLNNTFNNM